MDPSSITYLPVAYILIQVIFDTLPFIHKTKSKKITGFIFIVGFLTYISALFYYGVAAATLLLNDRLNSLVTSNLLATFIVSISYHLFKTFTLRYPQILGVDHKTISHPGFQIFLHYFAYTSFSAICFITFTFIVLIFRN